MDVVKGMLHQISSDIQLALIPEVLVAYKWVFLVMAFGFFTHWLSESWKDKMKDWFIASPLWVKAAISAVVVIFVYQSISSEMQPFIYFQF
jgi:hypothetical protein